MKNFSSLFPPLRGAAQNSRNRRDYPGVSRLCQEPLPSRNHPLRVGFRPLPICNQSPGSTSVVFRKPGSGMPTGNASGGLLHTGTAHFAGPALPCSPVPRCVSPCPESENAGATTMAIHLPPRANTRPKPAAMSVVHPVTGPKASTPALDVPSRHPGCHEAPTAVSREIFRCDTLALPRQDYRSHIPAAYAATASAPFFPGNPDFRGRWVPRSSRTPITKQGMNFEAKH